MVNTKLAIQGAVVTMIAFIMSVIAMFIGLLFLPLLNGTAINNASGVQIDNTNNFLTASARNLLEQVYPVLMILIPLFVLIAGLTTTAVLSRGS